VQVCFSRCPRAWQCRVKRELSKVPKNSYELLQGPTGTALRATGVILERKMRVAKVTWADLSDQEVADLFMVAFAEAAPQAFGHVDRATVDEAVAIMAATVAMEMAATADGNDTMN